MMRQYGRVVYFFVLLVGGFVVPFWAFLIIGLLGALVFPWFIEVLIVGFLLDSTFSTASIFGSPLQLTYTLYALGILVIGILLYTLTPWSIPE